MKRMRSLSIASTVLGALTLLGCGTSSSTRRPTTDRTLAPVAVAPPHVNHDAGDHPGPAPIEAEATEMSGRPEPVLSQLEKEERPLGGGAVTATPPTTVVAAEAKLAMLSGGAAVGQLTFLQQERQVVIQGSFTGLPKGNHGFYIYEQGDCGKQTRNARGHFNPTRSQHGAISSPVRHAGDFGNLVVNEAGEASFDLSTDSLTVAEGIDAVVGHTIVIHRRKDDRVGNAGPAIACGVITLAAPSASK